MIERLLARMQRNFSFITVDVYPDFEKRMDRARISSQTAILRLHRDAELVEREIARSREHGKGTDFADDMLLGKE
jgi:hypothetical protein